MGSSSLLSVSLLAPLVILSLSVILICASILLRSRPLVLNGQVLAWVLVAAALPVNVGIVSLMITSADTAVICYGIFVVLIQVVAYAAVIRAMRGTFIIGVSAEGCRVALREVFRSLELLTSETITGFDFADKPGRLQVTMATQLGTAQLKLAGVEDSSLLTVITREAKTYFLRNRGEYFLQSALIYGVSGITGLLLAIYQWSRF
ncbi:hypothetical protein EG834_01375 [bacterium]|nr:hypothetical protein [bacterium]